jgi:UDP-N-acetylglucosamine 3-dehydrogenase
MSKFRAGIIGCGRPSRTEGATGAGMAHAHVQGYQASADCELVAAADIRQENLDLFCEQYGIPKGYLDSQEMLAKENLDIVSVCLWPHLHAPMVIRAAQAGVKAIHCEKPMATTWGEARRMAAACAERGVQLTLNHQRRFGGPFRTAKELLDGGAIGELTRLEAFTSNLYDWGTHWFDMMFFYNDETPVEWVIGQIDVRGGRKIFGVTVEGQGLSFFKWQNGVYGLMATGSQVFRPPEGQEPREPVCGNRLIGTEGVIEVAIEGGPKLRYRNLETDGQWQVYNEGEIHSYDLVTSAILDLVDALKTGREPELSARKALQATELIFATYESSRSRRRIDLPLEIEDSPLASMIEAGLLATEEA